LILVLAVSFLSLSCRNIATVRDDTIPRLLTPLTNSEFNELVAKLQPSVNLKSLRAQRVLLQFLDVESSERYRTAEAIMLLNRPDQIRVIVQVPVTGSQIADMVSEANHFKVAIYRPQQYRRFLSGTNDADYSAWRSRLPKNAQSALIDARPFHFTDALMIKPLHVGEPGFIYHVAEEFKVEPDTRRGAKKNARVLRGFYVISEVELPATPPGLGKLRRRFWFDRTDQSRFTRQQVYDAGGRLSTDVEYASYAQLNPNEEELRPSVVLVSRPHENYSARLTFIAGRFEVNPTDLPPSAFVLENKEGLPETDLDKANGEAP
jgi:hypothetical protein